MAPPVIEVRDLVKRYNGREAVLDGVSLSVGEKELVTVYGKSGCGKTTLLNIIGGSTAPRPGRCRLTERTSHASARTSSRNLS